MTINNSLRAEIKMYEASNKQLENLNQMLKDEHQALHLAFTALEEKLKKAQVNVFYITFITIRRNYCKYLIFILYVFVNSYLIKIVQA